MALDVAVYYDRRKPRSRHVCDAMMRGISRAGDRPRRIDQVSYKRPVSKIAVFYGLSGNLAKVMRDHQTHGRHAVYIDLGYWGRKEGGRFSGYHKISVDARHPTAYFQNRAHSFSRVERFNLSIKPWGKGEFILVAGMSGKASLAEYIKPEVWEREKIAELLRITGRSVLYRPKPNWPGARPIPGSIFENSKRDIADLFQNCHAVVTHHSNVAVDALIAGVPTFCWGGVAEPMSLQDLSFIETPLYPDGREQWLADIAWCQWSVTEMAAGWPWRHLKDEGLLE